MITIQQCRAARGLLDWTQQDLADACGLSKTAVNNFEKGNSDMKAESLKAIRRAFESADVVFDGDSGLKKRHDFAEILAAPHSCEQLIDDIIITLDDTDEEVMILEGGSISNSLTVNDVVKALNQHHITYRLLGAAEKILPHSHHTKPLHPSVKSTAIRQFIYGRKLALQLWDNETIVIIDSHAASAAERARFEMLWDMDHDQQRSHSG